MPCVVIWPRSGSYLVTGSQDGSVHAFDLRTLAGNESPVRPVCHHHNAFTCATQESGLAYSPGTVATFRAHADSVNGIRCACHHTAHVTSQLRSLHPALPMLATSSGQRHFALQGRYDSGDEDESPEFAYVAENTVKLWAVEPLT